MIEAGGAEYRIKPYTEIEKQIGYMAKIALISVQTIDMFNARLDSYEGLSDERRDELRMEHRAAKPMFHLMEHFTLWTGHGNFVNNFSIASNMSETSRRGQRVPVPATAEQLLALPTGRFRPLSRLHGRHAERHSYLRSLIVPECAEVIVPLTIAVSEHYARWHGKTDSHEARVDRRRLQKGLHVAHNILAKLTDKRDPYADLRQ